MVVAAAVVRVIEPGATVVVVASTAAGVVLVEMGRESSGMVAGNLGVCGLIV